LNFLSFSHLQSPGAWTLLAVALVTVAIWLVLWLGYAGFWRIDRHPVPPTPEEQPSVTAVIPARNETAVIGETLHSLWRQGYPSTLHVIVVDDHSEDGTAGAAREAAREAGRQDELQLISSAQLPVGWTGKVWAMHQGVESALSLGDGARYILFSDADISHGPGSLEELVSRAEAGRYDLTSFMVRLRCESPAEKLMIPAFVFFFRMLYPFRRVNAPRHSRAGAAGGTMLVRQDALERIGGLTAIRHELIDDCSLAREIKRGGHPIWLGLSETSSSTRGYGTLGEVIRMIARTAYTQLGYSPLRLAGCVIGLSLTFLAPPLLLAFAGGWARILGGAAWMVMSLLYLPMVRFYRQSPLLAPLLPLTAVLYLSATIVSALHHHRGRGGQWKGRAQSAASSVRDEAMPAGHPTNEPVK
jgi:hopene-associated glycosyltransferase HpnB